MPAFDLTLMGRDVNFTFETAGHDSQTRAASCTAPAPVLLVPDTARSNRRG
jgi:hypothetical protein